MPDHAILPTVLCIGGLDPSGGARLFADARACAAFGTLALPVATAIVPQNTRGVKSIEAVVPQVIAAQIETLLEDIAPAAVKIGLIPNALAVEAIAACLQSLRGAVPIVIDTVFAPTSGPIFNDEATIELLGSQLLSMATVVTPNALEARRLGAGEIGDLEEMKRAARLIFERTGAQNVLLKGGHVDDPEFAVDLLFDGAEWVELRARRERATKCAARAVCWPRRSRRMRRMAKRRAMRHAMPKRGFPLNFAARGLWAVGVASRGRKSARWKSALELRRDFR